MKIRQGHVSNSSSSSFVMVGVKIPEDFIKENCHDGQDFADWWYENAATSNLTMFNGNTEFLVGKQVMDDVEYSEMTRICPSDDEKQEIRDQLAELGIKAEIFVYAGSESE